jgi:hypothetical protein
MTSHDALLPAAVLQRKAIVYVRQSTSQQVQSNLESQRRQYEVVDVARRRGFTNVEIIDDDLSRSGFFCAGSSAGAHSRLLAPLRRVCFDGGHDRADRGIDRMCSPFLQRPHGPQSPQPAGTRTRAAA